MVARFGIERNLGMKKKFGIGLILFAIIMLIFYYIYLFSLKQKNNDDVTNYINTTSIQEEIIENIEQPIREEEPKSSYQFNYTAVLEIPTIGLKRGVVDSTKNFNSINYAISVDKNSHYPDSMGNFILYSHSGSASISYFRKLNNVEIDDSVYVYYQGKKYQYIIYEKYDIEKTGKAKIISSNNDRYITLITCNPNRKGYQTILIGKLKSEIIY